MAVKRRIRREEGSAAVGEWKAAPGEVARPVIATAVRYLLEELSSVAEGNAVEVRVPPFGVAQCVPGPRHTRGTPPNVVEMDPQTWLALATGATDWAEAMAAGKVSASGTRADVSAWLPLG